MSIYNDKIRVFISVPMSGRTDEEIEESIQSIETEYLDMIFDKHPEWKNDWREHVKFVHNFKESGLFSEKLFSRSDHKELLFLATALWRMSTCDEIAFAYDWEKARGCQIEFAVWDKYNCGPMYFPKITDEDYEPRDENTK